MASPINEAVAGSSSSSFQKHYTYEVFLSFRGEDTRYNFTDHLHAALCLRGIKTFRDDDELRKGEEISEALLKAIEESRVSIVVFSQNYASSKWCLDELVKILECKSKGQQVKPVFYNVAPSHVRHQIADFGDAFHKLEDKYKDSMGKWRKALKEAANLSGWTYEEDRYETEFIKDIVEELSIRVVNPSYKLPVARHPIGLEPCIQDVNSLLKVEQNIVRMMGIWGPGGIGKTTVAKAVFNSISHQFECCCFLRDVRSTALIQLQETLLSRFLNSTQKVSNVDEGVSFIETQMQHKKVLLILDDVSDSSQLEKLVPFPNCFGLGSRILITTRDKRSLIAHKVDEVYEVKMLHDCHALELFSLHAFIKNEPPSDYLELAQRAVRYAGGLPLALIVLGSHLFRRSRKEWEATLDSFRGEDFHRKIREVLKISYDALGVELKGYFLDIACFFKGKLVDYVKPILDACYDLKSVNGIAQLQEKALIRIDNDEGGWIWMHDLIEEMGKDIVHQESPDEPGERSRVWSKEDVNDVLTKNTGTNKLIGIQARLEFFSISLNAKSFSEMKKLRYISMGTRFGDIDYPSDFSGDIDYLFDQLRWLDDFSGDIDYLSDQLRWLDWPGCPLQCFPSNFHAKKLVNLNIFGSYSITRLWEGRKNFPRLTCMNLGDCTSLKELPDFSGIPNLKQLNLFGCISLVEVPDSIRFLHNLVTLNLSCCKSLKKLPDFSGIPNLKELDLSRCSSLVEVPDSIRFLHNLVTLNLRGCESLKKLPDFSGIPNLKELDLSRCTSLVEVPDSIRFLHNLVTLNLSDCESLKKLPDFSGIPNLKELDLSRCTSLVEVPDSVGLLDNLVTLYVDGCSNLNMFPRKINLKSVETISISYCKLEEFSEVGEEMVSLRGLNLTGTCIEELHPSITRLIRLEELGLWNCKNLTTLPYNIYELHTLKTLSARGCSKLATFPKIPVKMDSLRFLSLIGSDIRELDESIGNLIGLEYLHLANCKNLTTLPCNIYGLQNLVFLDLGECSKLVRFPTNTKILNVDVCSLSLPKLREFNIAGCSLLSDCDFLMTLNCWETLEQLNLSRNNFVSLPACLTKFVKLWMLDLQGCTRLRGIPELPPSVVGLRKDSCRRLYLKDSDIAELDESIEDLIGMEELDLWNCKNLTTLPYNIYELHTLKTLSARGCSKLATFPKIPVKMDSLRLLSLKGSDIRELDESIGNLIGLEYLDLTNCKNLTTLPCSIYGLQNLWFLDLGECSKLVRFPTNTKILDVDGCSLSLPKLGVFSIAGCSSLSDCDFLMTLDCWETLLGLNLSRNNFVSLPACFTKFVKLRVLDLSDCMRLREIPELPPNIKPPTWGCELLEERSTTLTNRGAVIEAASPSIEEPTPSSWLSLSSETLPVKRQSTAAGGQAPVVPMIPDLQTHHGGWHFWRLYLLSRLAPSTRAAGACSHHSISPQLQHHKERTEMLWLSMCLEQDCNIFKTFSVCHQT